MPQKSSRRNAANQHDKRHETGLAAPGKRIIKQRSTSNLNGSANGKPTASTPPLPAADVDQQPTLPVPVTPNGSAHGNSFDIDMAARAAAKPVNGTRARFPSDASLEAPDNFSFEHVNGAADTFGTPRRGETNGSANSTSAYKGNMFTLATTILSSCPLQDVIAILIILLQLGPTALTIVHALFTALTFVPPSNPTSISSLPSLTDMFHGSGGTPSVSLILFMDAVILCGWLAFWVPLQNLVLDLAQAVIAISLGGAAAGKSGTTQSMIICSLIIATSNLGRCGYIRQYLFQFGSDLSSKWGFPIMDANVVVPTTPTEACSIPYGWLRSLLGVHILAQGFLRIVRRHLSRREQAQAIATKKVDPDPTAAAQARKNSNSAEQQQEPPTPSSTDGRPPGQPPATRETKEKHISTKKKKRQATHVRSQQPFWAAIASTKVTVLKEMEQNQAANDAEEAQAMDSQHIGTAQFQKAYEDRVWITNVGSTEISFGASLFQLLKEQTGDADECPEKRVESVKPFYVRVNGTVWRSARVRQISTNSLVDEGMMSICKGEITGLTPFSNYHVDFVRTTDDAVLCTTSLITPPDSSAELASATSPAAPKTLRPSSPATTLKNSIAGADSTLQEQRNRFKRNKKEHRHQLATIRSDLEKLSNRLSGAGGNDDRQQSKLLQFKRELTLAEEAIAAIDSELASLGDIPEEEHDAYTDQRKAWRAEKDKEASTLEDLTRCKSNSDRNVASLQSDIASALQKRERLVARQTKLNEQQERLKKVAEDALKQQTLRAEELNKRAIQEEQFIAGIEQFELSSKQSRQKIFELEGQLNHLDAILQHSNQPNSNPATPEAHTAYNNVLRNGHGVPFQSFNGFPNGPGTAYYQQTRRGRSSSMLSGVSGFTDDFDDSMDSMNPYENVRAPATFQGPYIWGTNGVDRKGSSGSGSGSTGSTGSGSGSQRDPLSPIPQSATEASFPKGSMSPHGVVR